jgi:uncharacterized protein (DUF736 family)
MPAIGHVTKSKDGKSYKGQLKCLSFKAPIDIQPNTSKNGDNQPDFRVYSGGVDIGAGWVRTAESSGNEYVSLGLADPAFGPKRIFANLGRAPDQSDPDVYSVIWNPES